MMAIAVPHTAHVAVEAGTDAAGLEPVDGNPGLLSQARGLGGAGTAVTDERQAHVRAEGDHGGVAAHARIPPGTPVGGVTFDQAAMGSPDAFGDLVGAARAGPGDQQGVAVMPVPGQGLGDGFLVRPGA